MPVDIEQLKQLQLNLTQAAPGRAATSRQSPSVLGVAPVSGEAGDTPSKETLLLTYLQEASKSAAKNVQSEVDRITDLPIEMPLSSDLVQVISRFYCPSGTWNLWPSQCQAIVQYHKYQGVFIPLKVGGGKTLIICIIASDAYSEFGKERIVVHCPANLVQQLKNKELPKYRQHISINVPFTFLSDMDRDRRLRVARSGRKGCSVVPYSLLSSPTGAEIMNALRPDLILCDEVHKVASVKMTGRTRRFREAVETYHPDIVALSGTITKKKAIEYHFIVKNALKERSFLPETQVQAEAWSKMIDCDADNFETSGTQGGGPIQPLIAWAEEHTKERIPCNIVGFRKAVRVRMETCPGVVASDEDDLGVSLRITNRTIPKSRLESTPGFQELKKLIKTVTEDWKTPDGDEIDYGIHLWKWKYELEGFGAYNSLYWPTLEKVMKRKVCNEAFAKKLLEDSMYAHELGQEYHRTLRGWLTYNARSGLDTPMLVGNDMLRNGHQNVGTELYCAWDSWRAAKRDDAIDRDSRFVRVCPFRLNEILIWAAEHMKENRGEGAVIWYKHQGVGAWIYEEMQKAGFPVIHCPSGKKGDRDFEEPAHKPYFAVTSISAHYQGHNCQHWGFQYFAQFPREAHITEQAIGRIHRNGQERDEVQIITNISSTFDQVLLSACLNDAAYIHQTTPTPQKLIYADYDTTPNILPYAVLKEWGADPRRLDQQTRQLISNTFIEEDTDVVAAG